MRFAATRPSRKLLKTPRIPIDFHAHAHPYPSDYRMAFALSSILRPHRHGQALRPAVPVKGAIRDFHVPLVKVRRLRRLLLAGKHMGHDRVFWKRQSHFHYLLVKRKSHFRLFPVTTFIADSHVFAISTIWHSSGLWLPEGYASRD
jgi:hypothetical protein